MNDSLPGIHHVTALAGSPQQNIDFYTRVLGLRLVKQTVNFDSPDVYHFYYGNETGNPGTILTFFPFPNAARGERGTGEVSAVQLLVPHHSMDFWAEHLSRHGVPFDGPQKRFDDEIVSFVDPDGMQIELTFSKEGGGGSYWQKGPLPEESAIRGIYGVTLMVGRREESIRMVNETLGFFMMATDGNRTRFSTGEGSGRAFLDLVERSDLPPARQSAGSVHHVAWRVASEEAQRAWRQTIADKGIHITEVLDRKYFRSVYFREPGGVLFELATDQPGFTVDESIDRLGQRLQLPGWLEANRERIERLLPPIIVPSGDSSSLRSIQTS